VGHVGNVYAYFPQAVLQAADGEGVVKVLSVLGVDGEGRDGAEVFAAGYLFGGNLVGDAFGRLLYGCRITVGQAVFGQDGVHLGGVVARTAQDVDDLSDGVLGLVGPFDNLHHGLVAALAAFQFVFGDEDVVGQRAVFGDEEGIRLGHFERAHEGVVGTFQYLDDFTFGAASATFGIEGYLHAVAGHGVGRVAFGNEDGVASAVGDEGVLAVALALEDTRHLHTVEVEFVFVLFRFVDVVVVLQFVEHVHAEHFQRMGGQVKLVEDVLQGQHFALFLVEEVEQSLYEFLFGHAFAGLLFFLFFFLSHNGRLFYQVWRDEPLQR